MSLTDRNLADLIAHYGDDHHGPRPTDDQLRAVAELLAEAGQRASRLKPDKIENLMTWAGVAAPTPDRLLDLRQAASLLGTTKDALRMRIERGSSAPTSRVINRRRMFRRSDVEKWIADQFKTTEGDQS